MTGLSGFGEFAQVITSGAFRAISGHCDNARAGRLMPGWEDLNPGCSNGISRCFGIQLEASSQEFVGRLAGTHVNEWLRAKFWGARLREIHPLQFMIKRIFF
jgi:hypothetical protein